MSTSYASTPVIVRQGSKPGEIEAVCFTYTKKMLERGEVVKSFMANKFPTETGEKGETPWRTALSGVRLELSEVPDSLLGFELRSMGPMGDNGEPEPFLVSRVRGDPGKSEWHEKIVFLVQINPDSVQYFRKKELEDGPDEVLGVPEFVELSELWRRMCERGQPFHRAVLYRVIQHFVDRYPGDICPRYRAIIKDPRSQDAISSRGVPIQFVDS
jgi:hypothetical protein